MSESFFQYISDISLKVETVPKHRFIMNPLKDEKPNKRVFFAEPKVIRLTRKFGKIKADIPYTAKYFFKYDPDTRYTIVLTSAGEYQVFTRDKIDITDEKGSKIIREFFDRFYNIDIEIILQKLINFPPEIQLPLKLKLSSLQQNIFLSQLEKELNIGMEKRKIVTLSHSKMIKDYHLMAMNDLRDFLKGMFTDECELLVDYEELVKVKPKKPNNKNSNFKTQPQKQTMQKKADEK